MLALFGTSGIRGDAEKLFTHQFCFDLGRTFGEFLRRHKSIGSIAIGMDPRTSSPRIKKQVMEGLSYCKLEIFDEGTTPIPSINWLVKSAPHVAGIMITGSHIAPALNGIKFFAHDEEISYDDEVEIERIYNELKEKVKPTGEKYEYHIESRAISQYFELLNGLIKDPLPKWRVAVDCANGAQTVVVPSVLRNLGFTVIEVNCDIQKDFIARDTDTDDKAGLEELKKVVREKKCDFGIAFDGDGDRVVFIDEKGQFVIGEYSCSLIARDLPGDIIVTTIAASQVVETLGKKVVRTQVGSPFVTGKMKELGAQFGFEPNGGAVSAEIQYTRDGGTMAMKMLNLFAKFDGKFSDMIGQLPKFYMSRNKVDYPWELKDEIIKKAREHFKGVKVDETDGLKIWMDETTWMLFRSSANAPEFRVFAESKNEIKAKQLLHDGIEFVENIISANVHKS